MLKTKLWSRVKNFKSLKPHTPKCQMAEATLSLPSPSKPSSWYHFLIDRRPWFSVEAEKRRENSVLLTSELASGSFFSSFFFWNIRPPPPRKWEKIDVMHGISREIFRSAFKEGKWNEKWFLLFSGFGHFVDSSIAFWGVQMQSECWWEKHELQNSSWFSWISILQSIENEQNRPFTQ